MTVSAEKLKVHEITKYYDGKPVIQNVNLSIYDGEIVGLLGPSGVGKTTLFNIIAGIDSCDEGDILYMGTSIKNESGHVSYMLQKDLLLPFKTIEENVALPLLINKVPKKIALEKVNGYFVDFGLEGYQKKYPAQLSGGMRQRAALLRTYMFSKELCLLDEPFSALDTITKHRMHKWFLDILPKMKMTTLFITHDINEALYLSNRVVILKGNPGQIGDVFIIDRKSMTRDEFMLSTDFLEYKKAIYESMGEI